MEEKSMRIAVIPARGGSKRIPKKNIVPFCGRPMISYAIDAARTSGVFSKIHISTDSQEIRETVETLGLAVDFMRDPALADDYTGLLEVLRWVLDQYQRRGEVYKEVCCIMPTAPFLVSEDLKAAFELFHRHNGKYPLYVMAKYPVPIEWAFLRDKDGFMNASSVSKLSCRSQDLPEAYYECGPFTIMTDIQIASENHLSGKVLPYIMPGQRAVDIDTPEDLERAKFLFQLKNIIQKELLSTVMKIAQEIQLMRSATRKISKNQWK